MRHWTAKQDSAFFDAVADGLDISRAARRAGKTAEQGRARFGYVRRRLEGFRK